MKIQRQEPEAGAYGCHYYKETSHAGILGSSLHAFHFKTRESLQLQVNYQASFYKMVLCLDGFSKSYQNKKHMYSFNAGKVLLYKTNTGTYFSELKEDTEYNLIHLHFSQAMIEEINQFSAHVFKSSIMEIPMSPVQAGLFKNPNHFRDVHPALANIFIEKTMLDQLYAFAATSLNYNHYRLLKSGSDREKIYAAKELLDQSVTYISIEVLAKEVGMNTFKLKKMFREEFHKPVFEYQVDVHFSKAYTLLLETTDSIEEVAIACGYQNTGSFSNAFKRKFGMRPSDLRKY
ncbi:MAG: helix-turn-helix domain-containing protein [Cytophaga sp.]|uniref:helix-turn-helix domain-containing protein n=1 Tax=Cytophaga sp. TaxID=29535 RepID=UPI003F81B71B